MSQRMHATAALLTHVHMQDLWTDMKVYAADPNDPQLHTRVQSQVSGIRALQRRSKLCFQPSLENELLSCGFKLRYPPDLSSPMGENV